MVHIFRRHQQPLMIGFTILTIITFAGFYTHTDFLDKGHAGRVAEIYGHNVTLAQAQRSARKADLAMQLRMGELYQSLAATSSPRDAKENFIWNDLVLKHEAERLGLDPTDDEIVDATKAMEIFQTDGHYEPTKYNIITQIALNPRGFTPEDLSDLIGDDLRVKKIKALLGATLAPSESEIREAVNQMNEKTEASVVRFKFNDFLTAARVPEDEVKKLYEERKSSLKTDELRKVKFVDFTLPPPAKPTDKPLAGKERAEALTKLQKTAEDFTVAMADKNAKFDEVAAKQGLKVQESSDFPATVAPGELGASREAAAAAFKLTEQDPNSDVVEAPPKGYYVLQLVHIDPPRQLSFDEARANLLESLKHDRAQEALTLKATEVRNKIEAALKAGKTFAAAAQELGVKAEDLPAFSQKESKIEGPDAGEIVQTAAEMKEGQVSNVTPTSDGSIIIYVSKRLPIDEKQFAAAKPEVVDRLQEYQQIALFEEWLKLRRAAAQLKTDFRAL